MGKKAEFRELFSKAKEVGMEAGKAAVPPVMVIAEADIFGKAIPGGKRWVEPEGPCGFAWVKVRPGNSPFANWLKKNDLGSKAYDGGVDIWVSDFNQSMVRKEACANAMAKVLSEAGIKAYSASRMD